MNKRNKTVQLANIAFHEDLTNYSEIKRANKRIDEEENQKEDENSLTIIILHI